MEERYQTFAKYDTPPTSKMTISDVMLYADPSGLRLDSPHHAVNFRIESDGVEISHAIPWGWAVKLAHKIIAEEVHRSFTGQPSDG